MRIRKENDENEEKINGNEEKKGLHFQILYDDKEKMFGVKLELEEQKILFWLDREELFRMGRDMMQTSQKEI